QRKVGGSTPPLTTRSDQAIRPLTCGNALFWPSSAAAPWCPSETPGDRLWQSTAARGLHGPVVSTAAFRTRAVPVGAYRRATTGPREAGTAARRRLAAPVGPSPGRARLLPTPRRGQSPRHFPLRPSSR